MELEGLGQIDPGPDDRSDHRDALEHRLEDRQAHEVVGGQADEDQGPAALEAPEGLLARRRGHREDDATIGPTESLDGRRPDPRWRR